MPWPAHRFGSTAAAEEGVERLEDAGERARAGRDGAFRTIVQSMADGIVIVDGAGRTCFVNPAAEALFGRSAAELNGRHFEFPLSPAEPVEIEVRSAVRGLRIAELRVTATEWEGEPALLASIRDVTEHRLAEARDIELAREQTRRAAAESAERRARFLGEASRMLGSSLDYGRTLPDIAGLAVPFLADWCIIDVLEEDGRFTRVGLATSSPRGHALIHRLRAAAPRLEPDAGATRALRDAEPQLALDINAPVFAGVLGLDERDGDVAAAGLGACMAVPLRVRDRPLGLLTLVAAESGRVFDDDDLEVAAELGARIGAAIDNGRLFRQARHANEAKTHFLAVMSHELRTPLHAIIGYADLLMLGVPAEIPAPALDHARRVRHNARHLHTLIEEILTFSRIEAGGEELHIERVPVGAIVADVVALIEPLTLDRNLDFSVSLIDDELTLETDAQKVRQVLLNLLSNAIKFTDRGNVSLRVRPEDGHIDFTVTDTGRGIDDDDVPRIFEPFWQAEQTRTRRADGTGLGLSVARRLARMLGGDITVESRPGSGATFTVRLPRTFPQLLRSRNR